jgi:Lar family restriction alleviation protein
MSDLPTSNELLPCPFCGQKALMTAEHDADGIRWLYIKCKKCGARTRGNWHSPGNDCPELRGEVRDEWNRRAAAEPLAELPAAWVIPGDDTASMNGFIDARIDCQGEFTKPLYARPAQPPSTDRFYGVPRDRPIWICSVCNGWNHAQYRFCTNTHALKKDAAPPPADQQFIAIAGHYANCQVYEGTQRGPCTCRELHEQSSAPPPSVWQPIETAPHNDGFACIVSVPNEGPQPYVGEAHFVDEEGWYWAGNDPTDSWGPGALTPSHWMPLPSSPVTK